MEIPPDSPLPLLPPSLPPGVGYASNAGRGAYFLNLASDTGFVAWQADGGKTVVEGEGNLEIPATPSITFWAYNGEEPGGTLTALDCYESRLTRLEVQGLVGLEWLDCHANELTSLDVSGLKALKHLDCSSNRLGSLVLTGATGLKELFCEKNQLTELILRDLAALEYLDCRENRLATLDTSGLDRLQTLICSGNQIRSLDLGTLKALQNCDFGAEPC